MAEGSQLLGSEKEALLTKIQTQYSKIQNLHVDSKVIGHFDDAHKPDEAMDVTYAYSGEKRFTSMSDLYSPDGQSNGDKEYFVWNGKMFTSYSTSADAGMLLPPTEDNKPPKNESGSQFSYYTGEFTTNETFAQLFARIPVNKWNLSAGNDGSVLLSTASVVDDSGGVRYTWRMDPSHSYVVKETTVEFAKPDNSEAFVIRCHDLVEEIAEVIPGVWLPKASTETMLDDQGNPTYTGKMHVANLEVNNPKTEGLFEFTLPKGCKYYDGVLKDHFIAGMNSSQIQELMDASLSAVKNHLPNGASDIGSSQQSSKSPDQLSGHAPSPFRSEPIISREMWIVVTCLILIVFIGFGSFLVARKRRNA
jgi:hypothetical protein